MIVHVRRSLFAGRRRRRGLLVAGWLSLIVAFLPCALSASVTCCPPTDPAAPGDVHDHGGPTIDGSAHASAHDAHHDRGQASTPDRHGGDCWTRAEGACCDPATPTLEDRTPKTPAKIVDLPAATTPASIALARQAPRGGLYAATGPPVPSRAPARLSLYCRWLI